MAPRDQEPDGDKTTKMPRRTRAQQRTATITAERNANHHARTTPTPPPHQYDEDLTYEDTLTTTEQPPPF